MVTKTRQDSHLKMLIEGNRAFQEKRYPEALHYFIKALKNNLTILEKAELFHYVALTYLEMEDFKHYFQNERAAAGMYASVNASQSADFLKEAGDILKIVGQKQLSLHAYRLAATYFSIAASSETNNITSLGLRAWENFCKAKGLPKNAGKYYEIAASLFFETADCSTTSSQYWSSKGHYSTGLSCVGSSLSENNLERAIDTFSTVLVLNPEDIRTKICLLVLRSLKELMITEKPIACRQRPKRLVDWLTDSKSLIESSDLKLFRFSKVLVAELASLVISIEKNPMILFDQKERLISQLIGLFNLLS